MLNFGIPLPWLELLLAWVLGSGGELVGCVSVGLGIEESAFHVSSWGLTVDFPVAALGLVFLALF